MHVRANGIDIHYEIEGDDGNPWIVMSHSLACDFSMWNEQVGPLSRRYRVLRYDTRGHGGTTATSPPYTLDLLAEDAKALLDALGIARAHWVGLSLGGMIGEAFALRYPERLASLVLCDTTSRYPASAAAAWDERIRNARTGGMAALADPTLARWFTPAFHRARPEVIEAVRTTIVATPVDGYAGCGLAIATIDLTSRLPALNLPTLVLVGADDQGTPVAMAREIEQAIPGARLVVIPEAAHLSNIEQAAQFNEALLGFLGSIALDGPRA
jgi:3-oxoadipate enol-lactonase